MKRSEFSQIVNTVCDEESKKFSELMRQSTDAENRLVEMLGTAIAEIPSVAARTTAEILVRSGVISLEDDA